MESIDAAAVLLRITLGVTMIAHGWNHAFGGGGLAGTTRWFSSIGMRAPRLNALAATVTELGAGVLLLLGLLTPLAAAGLLGTMVVALISNHLKNGFFIFRPGEGYEYVLMIIVASLALAVLGPGALSLDAVVGIEAGGWIPLLLAAVLGGLSGLGILAAFWRPGGKAADNTSA